MLEFQNIREGTLLSNLTLDPSLMIGSSNYEESFLEQGPTVTSWESDAILTPLPNFHTLAHPSVNCLGPKI